MSNPLLYPKLSWPFVVVLFFNLAAAQPLPHRAVLTSDPTERDAARLSPVQAVPLTGAEPFLSFFTVWEGAEEGLAVRFSPDGETWLPWQALRRDPHNAERQVSELLVTEPTARFFQLRYPATEIRSLACHFFDPGRTPVPASAAPEEASPRTDACPLPPVVGRSQWCPAGDCPPASTPAFTTVTHLIVHHSAGTNTANDWAAIVRAIWDLHVNGNGWADIGYNYLVDPNGVIYVGRGDNVLGAHFCGHNTNTMGVCVLGNFQQQAPSSAALEALVRILAWKADERGIDPFGISYHPSSGFDVPNLAGHRDGCATECPGELLYARLPEVRVALDQYQTTVCRGDATSVGAFGTAGEDLPVGIFPNPAGDQLWVTVTGMQPAELRLDVLAPDGRLCQTLKWEKGAGEATLPLSLSTLPAGLYCLRVWQNGAEKTLRFVRQ